MTASPRTDELLAALHRSHDRLAAVLASVPDEEVTEQSYAAEWTIAQVASHLGSGAEVFGLFLDAGVQHATAPGVEQFSPVWDRWNAAAPVTQAREAVDADAAFLARVGALPDEERERWRLDLFGSEQTLPGLLRMRLGEHALHTWDIAVARDPAATVPEDAAGLVLDGLPGLAERTGRPADEPLRIDVGSTGPERRWRLELTGSGVRLTAPASDDAPATASLALPAEAFVRLVYGRLDAGHTPAGVRAGGVDLDVLRRTFPGF